MSSTDSSPHLDEQGKTELAGICNFLKRPQDTISAWPFVCISKLKKDIVPRNPDAGCIPYCLVFSLEQDIRVFDTPLERSEHFAFYIGRSQVENMSEFWKATLHRILSAFANCPRPRTRNGLTSLILDNLFGLHGSLPVSTEQPDAPRQPIPSQAMADNDSISITSSEKDHAQHERTPHPMDLTQSIRIITAIFPPSDRVTGEETEPLMHRLQPMLDQMQASQIPGKYQVTTLFSLLTGSAKEVASKFRTHNLSITEFVQEIGNALVFEHNIQQRKMNRWRSVSFQEFLAKSQSHHKAVRECIEHLTAHQKDLTSYHRSDHHLLERLREVFEFEELCTTLYEQEQPTMSSTAFGNRHLTAASRFDSRQKRPSHSKASTSYHISQPPPTSQAHHTHTALSLPSVVAAFFAKTPPPRHRRPFRFRRYHRASRPWYANRRPPPALRNSSRRRCYGCQQPGHIVRNCPEKEKYVRKLHRLHQAGTGAHLIIQQLEEEPSDELEDIVNFVDDYFADEAEETSDFDTWICEFLDAIDEHTVQMDTKSAPTNEGSYHISQSAYKVKFSIRDLEHAMQELMVNNVDNIVQHLLIDPGSPWSICSESWLHTSGWIPVKKLALPPNIHPFRFAGHGIYPKYAVCLVAELSDITGATHLFRQVVFVLPPTPIPFLVGLQIQRSMSFDLCMRDGPDSHLKIHSWQSTHNLVVNSHVWLPFLPVRTDPDPSFDWTPIVNAAFTLPSSVSSNLSSFPVMHSNTPPDISSRNTLPQEHTNVVLPWEKDDWNSKLHKGNLDHLHRVLRHPQANSMLSLFRQQNEGRRVPQAIREYINKQHKECRPCQEHAELPRIPKISMPPPATPNIYVSLDVMPHRIRNHTAQILVILDHGDMMLRLQNLSDSSANTAYHAYLSRWISIFDAPVFTIVDRGSNLANQLMAANLRQLDSQLCPIPTEAPWSLGRNERSHRFLHKAIDRLLTSPDFEPGHNLIRLLAEVEITWNCTQHTNRILPHLHRFGIMPRTLGELDNSPTTRERIALAELLRVETEKLRAEEVLRSALHSTRRHVLSLKHFSVGQTVWFYRRNSGWRTGCITQIHRPTILVSCDGKLFPTHENRVRPHFGELSLPPEIRTHDNENEILIGRATTESSSPTQPVTEYNRAPITQIINSTFCATSLSPALLESQKSIGRIPNSFPDLPTGVIDGNETQNAEVLHILENNIPHVFITSMENIRDIRKLSKEQKEAFQKAKGDEIKFLLVDAVSPIPQNDMDPQCDLQPLKWVLAIKRSSNNEQHFRFRARLVSASHLSTLRHALNGNAPTVAVSTIRVMLSIAPTWENQLRAEGDSLLLLVRDVTKAYLQSDPTGRLVYYQPPKEYFQKYPDKVGCIWKANVQLYGDVEAGKYWHKTFVPWLCNNVLDYQQSMHDPSLLYSPTTPAATALCTDDALTLIPRSKGSEERKMSSRFKCRDAQEPPTDFKGFDIIRDGSDVRISQVAYSSKIDVETSLNKLPKPELNRTMTEKEVSQLRSDAGKLAWLAVGTSPLSSFQSSVALQRNHHRKVPLLETLVNTRKALLTAKEEQNTEIRYIPLDQETIHIRLYTDGSFQNLDTKHSQIGFIIGLADKNDNFNLVHWHSSRAPRRPCSTEQSELMALDIGLRSLENIQMIVFKLLKREVPVVVYNDCETLWLNLMNETVPNIPEIGYRCREFITDGKASSVCLIPGSSNPSDAMTKARPNKQLSAILSTNKCITPAKKVFMLQDSPYRHLSWIPTMRVPMPNDTQAYDSNN